MLVESANQFSLEELCRTNYSLKYFFRSHVDHQTYGKTLSLQYYFYPVIYSNFKAICPKTCFPTNPLNMRNRIVLWGWYPDTFWIELVHGGIGPARNNDTCTSFSMPEDHCYSFGLQLWSYDLTLWKRPLYNLYLICPTRNQFLEKP